MVYTYTYTAVDRAVPHTLYKVTYYKLHSLTLLCRLLNCRKNVTERNTVTGLPGKEKSANLRNGLQAQLRRAGLGEEELRDRVLHDLGNARRAGSVTGTPP